MKILLEEGADKDAKTKGGCTSLHIASLGHIEIVKILLEAGADKEAKDMNGLTPLHIASYRGHIEILTLDWRRASLM